MKTKKIIALITSIVMLLGVSAWANAETADEIEVTETVVEETTDETYEYSIPTDEYVEITEDAEDCLDDEDEEYVIDETDISTSETLSDDEEIGVEDVEEETLDDDSEDDSEDEEDEVDIEYDVEGFELYGWWVPSMNYNDDDTISYFLEDDTCYLTTPTAGVQCGNSIWQNAGVWSYVELYYGGADNLSGDEYSTYCAVLDYLS